MNNMCKKRVNYFEMLLGVITLVFGILIEARLQITGETQTPNISRFAGMLTGFGCGILIVGVVRLLRNRFSSKEKLKEREIEKNVYGGGYGGAISVCDSGVRLYITGSISGIMACNRGDVYRSYNLWNCV